MGEIKISKFDTGTRWKLFSAASYPNIKAMRPKSSLQIFHHLFSNDVPIWPAFLPQHGAITLRQMHRHNMNSWLHFTMSYRIEIGILSRLKTRQDYDLIGHSEMRPMSLPTWYAVHEAQTLAGKSFIINFSRWNCIRVVTDSH